MRKALLIFIGSIICVILIIVVYKISTTPNMDFIYNYNGKAYIQNSRSLFKKEIKLDGYDNISNVILSENGWFCSAKCNNKKCFLFVTKDNKVSRIFEDEFYYSEISDAMAANGDYQMTYTYKKSSDDNLKTALLTVDFSNQKLIYNKYPNKFSSYSFLSDGQSLWGSNGSKILKYDNGEYFGITDGNSVIGIQGNFLIFEKYNNIYKLNLTTKEVTDYEYKFDPYDYRTVDYESRLIFTNKYIVGCKIGYFELSGGNSLISHISITDLNSGKNYIVFGSIGKISENLQIITNRNEYKAFK